MMNAIKAMNDEIRQYGRLIEKRLGEKYAEPASRLRVLFGVGPITALYFLAAIGDPNRFPSGRQTGGYLGLGVRSGNRCFVSVDTSFAASPRI